MNDRPKSEQEAQLQQRDSASAIRTSFSARSLIVHLTERRICCIDKVVSTLSATQGHYRSFILQSVSGQQTVAYRHMILLVLSLKFPKK